MGLSAPEAAANRDVRVGYIAGYGRSGSTVFDIVLGEHPQIFGAGELTQLSRRVWPNNEYCSCGQVVQACPFWSEVVVRFLTRCGNDALSSYARLQARYEMLGQVAMAASGIAMAKPNAAYEHYSRELFSIVAELSGKPVIVDSSKLPGRGAALMAVRGLDVRLVHLVRDGRAVAWSMSRSYDADQKKGLERPLPGRSILRTALRWGLVNLGAEKLAKMAPRSARLHYEAFVAAPSRELRRIGDVLGLDMQGLIRKLESGEGFNPGHVVAGSRWRMSGPLRLRLDQEWRQLMPQRQQQTFQMVSGWLQRRYGY